MNKNEKNMYQFKKILDCCTEQLNLKYILLFGLFFTIELISKDLNLVSTYKFFSFSSTMLCFYFLGVFILWVVGLIGYYVCKHRFDKKSNIEKLIDEELGKDK